jgi:RNA polymerase sigma-70 factor (ECF subfamily)
MKSHEAAADFSGEPPDTAGLVGRAAAGDRGAFRELVHRYHATIYRWAAVSTGDQDEAEDIAQLVLIKVHGALDSYRGGSRFSTWLYTITRNVLLEQARTRRRRDELLSAHESIEPTELHTVPDDTVMDSGRLREHVMRYLAALPPRQREVFELADIQGFTPAEIAVMTGVEQVTVRTNLLKARRAIRGLMLREQPKLMEEFRS